jgi:lycopene cyclase domain-containing protein
MTYLQFHLVFILPPLLALVLTSRQVLRRIGPRAIPSLIGVVLLALVYTTPWDSELIRRGVWGYGPERVIGTIGLIPIEEYLFFILQPLLTGLWFYRMMPPRAEDAPAAAPAVRWGPAVLYALLAVWGVMLLRTERGTYLGMILVWAAPVLAAQWAVAGGRIGAAPRTFALAVGIPVLPVDRGRDRHPPGHLADLGDADAGDQVRLAAAGGGGVLPGDQPARGPGADALSAPLPQARRARRRAGKPMIPTPQEQRVRPLAVILRKAPTPRGPERAAARAPTEESLSETGAASRAETIGSRRDGAPIRQILRSAHEAWCIGTDRRVRLPQNDSVPRTCITDLFPEAA